MADLRKIYLPSEYYKASSNFKDQARNGYYFIKFFDVTGTGTGTVGDINDIDSLGRDNLDNTNNMNITMFTKSVSGLQMPAMGEVSDTLPGGWKNILPGLPENPSGTLTIDIRVLENLGGLVEFTERLYRLYHSQTQIYNNATVDEGSGSDSINKHLFSFTDGNGSLDLDSANLGDNLVNNVINKIKETFSDNFGSLGENNKIYFKTSVSALSYTTKKPIFNLLHYNCWIKSISFYDTVNTDGANIQNAKISIRYDLSMASGTNYRD